MKSQFVIIQGEVVNLARISYIGDPSRGGWIQMHIAGRYAPIGLSRAEYNTILGILQPTPIIRAIEGGE